MVDIQPNVLRLNSGPNQPARGPRSALRWPGRCERGLAGWDGWGWLASKTGVALPALYGLLWPGVATRPCRRPYRVVRTAPIRQPWGDRPGAARRHAARPVLFEVEVMRPAVAGTVDRWW